MSTMGGEGGGGDFFLMLLLLLWKVSGRVEMMGCRSGKKKSVGRS